MGVFLIFQGFFNPKIRFLCQKVCSVARGQTDIQTDRHERENRGHPFRVSGLFSNFPSIYHQRAVQYKAKTQAMPFLNSFTSFIFLSSTGQVTDAFIISNTGELLANTDGWTPLSETDTHTLLELLKSEPGNNFKIVFLDRLFTFFRCPRHSVLMGKSGSTMVLALPDNSRTLVAFTDANNVIPALKTLKEVLKQILLA